MNKLSASRLKSERLKKKKTQKDVADFLGMTKQAVQRYESGLSTPKLATWKKLADYFNVPVMELIDPEDAMNSVRKSVNHIRSENNREISDRIERVDQIITHDPLPQTSTDILKSLDVMLQIFDNQNVGKSSDNFDQTLAIQEKYSNVLTCLAVLLHAEKDAREEDTNSTNEMIKEAKSDFSELLEMLLQAQNKKATDND